MADAGRLLLDAPNGLGLAGESRIESKRSATSPDAGSGSDTDSDLISIFFPLIVLILVR
jgi:hypothetical protein